MKEQEKRPFHLYNLTINDKLNAASLEFHPKKLEESAGLRLVTHYRSE